MTKEVLTSPNITTVPVEVAEAFSISPERAIKLGGGLVNLTFAVESSDNRLALQRLSPGTPESAIKDFAVYTNHLRSAGWTVPAIRQTTAGQAFAYDRHGGLWRGMDYLECDDHIPSSPLSQHLLEDTGSLLARWHQTMSDLDYQPCYQIPHMHDTSYHIERLQENLSSLPDRCKILADRTLSTYASLDSIPVDSRQLIHGDPKLANMLFKDSRPFTMIDFDTVMYGPIWYDIGDLLRSIVKSDLSKLASAPETVRTVAESYLRASDSDQRPAEFIGKAVLAARHISLELTARYLNDIVEEDYFTWDEAAFESRADNHLSRAHDQWKVYESVTKGNKD